MQFLIGIAPIPHDLRLPESVAAAICRTLDELNAASERVVAEFPNAVFVPLRPRALDEFQEFGSASAYERWAGVLASRTASHLHPDRHEHRAVPCDEQQRNNSLDAVVLVGSDGHPSV